MKNTISFLSFLGVIGMIGFLVYKNQYQGAAGWLCYALLKLPDIMQQIEKENKEEV